MYWNCKTKKYQYKISISINNIDLNKRVVSNKVSFGKKKTLSILPVTKMLKNKTFMHNSSKKYRGDFDETKYIWFLI